MTIALTTSTRLFAIVGDPIAQVKSPGGMTVDPAGFYLVANATPAGMRVGDLLPVDVLPSRANPSC